MTTAIGTATPELSPPLHLRQPVAEPPHCMKRTIIEIGKENVTNRTRSFTIKTLVSHLMRPSYCLSTVATVILVVCASSSSSATRIETTTRSTGWLGEAQHNGLLRGLEKRDAEHTTKEERVPSWLKYLFETGKKSPEEIKQAEVAAKKAETAFKQTREDSRFQILIDSDDYIAKRYRIAEDARKKAVESGEQVSIDETFAKILAQTNNNDKFLEKMFGALKKARVGEKDLYNTLNIANSKTYESIHSRYVEYLQEFLPQPFTYEKIN